LILRKIIKIAATRCHILQLKCTKFDFGWGSAPDLAGGAISAPPDPQLDLREPTSNRRGRGGGRDGTGGEGKGWDVTGGLGGRGGERRRGKGRKMSVPKVTPSKNPRSATGVGR